MEIFKAVYVTMVTFQIFLHWAIGLRQGCPLSALLFLLVAEVLANNIRSDSEILGCNLPEKNGNNSKLKISSYADDTVLFLSDSESVKRPIEIIRNFG